MVTKLKLGKLPCIPLVSEARPRSSLDKEGAVWIRSSHSWIGKVTLQPVQTCEASQPNILNQSGQLALTSHALSPISKSIVLLSLYIVIRVK